MTRLRVSALLALAIGTTHGAAPAGPPFLPKICLRELQPPTLVRLPPITPSDEEHDAWRGKHGSQWRSPP